MSAAHTLGMEGTLWLHGDSKRLSNSTSFVSQRLTTRERFWLSGVRARSKGLFGKDRSDSCKRVRRVLHTSTAGKGLQPLTRDGFCGFYTDYSALPWYLRGSEMCLGGFFSMTMLRDNIAPLPGALLGILLTGTL